MEELIRYIVTSLVDHPEEISVKEIEGDEQTVLELRVSPKDVGKVIGKNGRIAKSLRAILTAASIKAGKNFSLEIID
ncbi:MULTISPECIES: KH domain-containing protein [Leptospira]|uniref:RNA-binding protein KhpA n=5 Tax=Leptospira TaxID=171 RepID=A0A4R9FU55_9LEPT|nr:MULTISPECIES: KH domain-containing protein [Leptospira]EIE01791.1 KH domain protein [Leptospira licerasiae serovar Varillal str. VAR 010]EJZ43493.1 KH domain protein [Leptospira licerasiae str. MMD4847]EMK01765.1 KH domain protein [Leptospira sp. B5-022]MCR1793836.1 KH domain-containing protein [Leptospira sp. id769339]PJZ78719.1 KH domain-containing protein [Leptospira neocaledonica]